jgi:hypothetical protein
VAAGLKRINGDPNSGIEFSQIVKLIAGKVIPEDTAPYDGTTSKLTKNGRGMMLRQRT